MKHQYTHIIFYNIKHLNLYICVWRKKIYTRKTKELEERGTGADQSIDLANNR